MLLSLLTAQASTLAHWIPTGTLTNGSGPTGGSQIPASTSHAGITPNVLFARSPTGGSNVDTLPHGYVPTSAGPNGNNYVTFGFSSGEVVQLTSVTYDLHSYGTNRADDATIRWSADGFSANLLVVPVPATNGPVTFDLSSLPLLNSPNVTFRVYFYDAVSSTWADLASDGLRIEGEVYFPGYLDGDDDGFGDPLQQGAGPDYVQDATDCNDADPLIRPGALEQCNGLDDDCDTFVDEDLFVDADGDGYFVTGSCGVDTFDCDDGNPSIHPGATEVCDGVDQDCADGADDGLDFETWWRDHDGDGYGDPETAFEACDVPLGAVQDATDCADGDPAISPAATDVPQNGVDEDCDGLDAMFPVDTGDTGAADTSDTSETGLAPGPGPGPEALVERPSGCGCQGGPAPLGLVWLGGLALLRRRVTSGADPGGPPALRG